MAGPFTYGLQEGRFPTRAGGGTLATMTSLCPMLLSANAGLRRGWFSDLWTVSHVSPTRAGVAVRRLRCGAANQAAIGGAAQWRATNSPWLGMVATASAIAERICASRSATGTPSRIDASAGARFGMIPCPR